MRAIRIGETDIMKNCNDAVVGTGARDVIESTKENYDN